MVNLARAARSRIATAVRSRVGLDTVLGVHVHVDGIDRLPDGPVVLAFNHLSPVDPFLLAWVLTEAGREAPVVLVRDDVPRIPVVSHLLDAGVVQVTDDTGDQPDDDVAASDAWGPACRQLESGRAVLIAPEGGVSPSLELMPLRSGAAHLAHATDTPVVPVGLFGTNRLFEGGQLRLHRGVPVTVVIGHPVMTGRTVERTTRGLHLDLEALYERALDDYPEREDGDAGAEWWPARRGGGAPSVAAVIDARAAGHPIWGDVGHDDPVGAEVWVEPAPEELPTPPSDEDEAYELPALRAMDHDELLTNYPRSYHRNAAQQGGYLRDLKVVLAFDLPGQPTEHHAVAHLDHHLDGHLTVHGPTARLDLRGADLRTASSRVVAYGRVLVPHGVETERGRVTVPRGTLVTLLGVPQDQPTPRPLQDWEDVQSMHLRA